MWQRLATAQNAYTVYAMQCGAGITRSLQCVYFKDLTVCYSSCVCHAVLHEANSTARVKWRLKYCSIV